MKHKGFTLIEVALFLAITGLLFVGIAVGTGNSIQQQRFYDATQTFAEFLRSIYSEVSNPQSVGDGRSEEAIYGKLITFGEEYGLDGTKVANYADTAQRIYVYDVVGDVAGSGSGSAEKMLFDVKANVVRAVRWSGVGATRRVTEIKPAGEAKTFIPHWGASLETTEQLTTAEKKNGANNLFEGSILVVRHPRSGTINTLVSDKVIQVNEIVQEFNSGTRPTVLFNGEYVDKYEILLREYLSDTAGADRFTNKEINFCINQYGDTVGTTYRWNVRITDNARNGSGVEIIDLDSEENKCRY